MDIFSRIDEQVENPPPTEPQSQVGEIIEKDGKYGYKFFWDSEKFDERYEFSPRTKIDNREGFFHRKRAERFYKFLFKTTKRGENQKQIEKNKKKRIEKIKKFLKKGINFREYFSLGMIRNILEKLPEDEIKLLYQYGGLNISDNLVHVYDQTSVCKKNIYYSISEFTPFILRHIPTDMLEEIIHTRRNLRLSEKTIKSFTENLYLNTLRRSFANIQLLIKHGQIYLTPQQIIHFCNDVEECNGKLIPELVALKQFAEKIVSKSDGKYSEQKHLQKTKQHTKGKSKSEAQQVIDKLFEDAQNAIE